MSIFTSKKVWNFLIKFSWQNLIRKGLGDKSAPPPPSCQLELTCNCKQNMFYYFGYSWDRNLLEKQTNSYFLFWMLQIIFSIWVVITTLVWQTVGYSLQGSKTQWGISQSKVVFVLNVFLPKISLDFFSSNFIKYKCNIRKVLTHSMYVEKHNWIIIH